MTNATTTPAPKSLPLVPGWGAVRKLRAVAPAGLYRARLSRFVEGGRVRHWGAEIAFFPGGGARGTTSLCLGEVLFATPAEASAWVRRYIGEATYEPEAVRECDADPDGIVRWATPDGLGVVWAPPAA